MSLIRLYTKIQRLLETQITSGVIGNITGSKRDVKRSHWTSSDEDYRPAFIRNEQLDPEFSIPSPGPGPAVLSAL